MLSLRRVLYASLLLGVILVAALFWLIKDPRSATTSNATVKSLDVWCAVGIKGPLEELALAYERAYGTRIHLRYGGSGTLLAGIASSHQGDLLIAADDSYTALARNKGLGAESIPLATMHPVIAVATGNPLQIRGWQDLLENQSIRLGLCHPESAAIGTALKRIAERRGQWETLEKSADVFKSSVTELAVDLKAGALDAAIIWDQTAMSTSGLEIIPCPELSSEPSQVPAIVLTCSQSPAASLHFARWIASPEHGAAVFRKHHFGPTTSLETPGFIQH